MKIDSGSNLSAPDLAFVVPVYRQPESLSELVRRVQVVADLLERSSEVILLDDGSPTDSWRALQKLAEDNPPTVRALRMPRNVGQHTAVLIGLREARGEWCVVLDQDLQDPPEAIAGLLRASDGVDVVFAGRSGVYQPFLRTLSGRTYRYLVGFLTNVPDDSGMFFIIRRSAVERLLDLRVTTTSVVAMIGLAGLTCRSQPTRRSAQETTNYTTRLRIRSGLRMLRCVAEKRLGLVREPIRRRIELLRRELETTMARPTSDPSQAGLSTGTVDR
jgi:glycosyltransferase involved in cell wall biosynthesis